MSAKRATDRLPFFPSYVRDFFGSARVAALDWKTQGAYAILLMREWQLRGAGLPAGERELAALLGCSLREWRRMDADLRGFFRPGGDGRLHNERLVEEWERAQRLHAERSSSGKKGAFVRWGGGGAEKPAPNGKDPETTGSERYHPVATPSVCHWQSHSIARVGISSSSSGLQDSSSSQSAQAREDPGEEVLVERASAELWDRLRERIDAALRAGGLRGVIGELTPSGLRLERLGGAIAQCGGDPERLMAILERELPLIHRSHRGSRFLRLDWLLQPERLEELAEGAFRHPQLGPDPRSPHRAAQAPPEAGVTPADDPQAQEKLRLALSLKGRTGAAKAGERDEASKSRLPGRDASGGQQGRSSRL